MRLPTIAALAVTVVVAGCAYTSARNLEVTPAQVARPTVERIDENTVTVSWQPTLAAGPVEIFAGLAPETIDRSRPLVRTTRSAVTLSRTASPFVNDRFRLYYQLVPAAGGAPVITSERRLPLDGPDNFRDLGGYTTTDGRALRWNRLYRSNDLSGLSPRDLKYLAGVGIKLICDFRSERERVQAPDREFPSGRQVGTQQHDPPEWLNLTVEQTGLDPDMVRKKIRSGALSAAATRDLMLRTYRGFVTDYTEQWAALFRKIAAPDNLPTVLHCTAGKDRTGFASALILLSLGVAEETVYEDYMLTNQYRRNFYAFVLRWISLYSFFRTSPDALVPLLEARREYLKAALDTIREKYGSVDEYLTSALGVTPEMREQIRSNVLAASG